MNELEYIDGYLKVGASIDCDVGYSEGDWTVEFFLNEGWMRDRLRKRLADEEMVQIHADCPRGVENNKKGGL